MRIRCPLLFISALLSFCGAWDCDERCPSGWYQNCLGRRNRNAPNKREKKNDNKRVLDIASLDYSFEDEHDDDSSLDMTNGFLSSSSLFQADNALVLAASDKKLRGSQRQRHLQQSVFFQLKLHHEYGYCWQAEWEDRFWCAECEDNDDTGVCQDWDYLEIKYCEQGEDRQYFQYEPIPNGIGGRIMPLTDDSLCWERTRVNAHQLRPCDDTNGVVNERQIFRGFDFDNEFELHPYNRGPNTTHPDGPMCLSQHHHPKKYEVIRAEDCETAREDMTNFWIAYNKYTEGDPNSVPSSPVASVGSPGPSDIPSALPSVTPSSSPTLPSATMEPTTSPVEQSSPVPVTEPSSQPATLSPIVSSGPTFLTGAPIVESDVPSATPSASPSSVQPVSASTMDPTNAPIETSAAPANEPSTEPATSYPVASSAGPTLQGENADLQPVVNWGWNGCSVDNKCPNCHGDCDDDDECEGDLICYKRTPNGAVPTCSGGEAILRAMDFCITPDWRKLV